MTLGDFRRQLANHLTVIGYGKAQANGLSRNPENSERDYQSGLANGYLECASEVLAFLNDDEDS